MNIATISWAPPVGMDDTFVSANAHHFINNNHFVQPMLRVIADFRDNELTMGRIHLGGLALTAAIFGPSLISDRLWPWAMSLVCLGIFWCLAKIQFGTSWGLAAVAICLVEPMFFFWTHIPRPEMTLATFFILGTWSALKAIEEQSAWRFFLSGLCAGLAVDVHLIGFILAPAVLISLLMLRKDAKIVYGSLFWYLLATLIGWSWYAGIHILPNPSLFFKQWNLHVFLNQAPGLDSISIFGHIPKEYIRYSNWFWGTGIKQLRLIEAGLILIGIVYMARSHILTQRFPALVTGWAIIIMTITISRKAVYYLMPLYPLFVIQAVGGLQIMPQIIGRAISSQAGIYFVEKGKKYVNIGLATLFLFYFSQDVIKILKFRCADYLRYATEIEAVVPKGTVMAGTSSLWYYFGKRNGLIATPAILWAIDYENFRGKAELSAKDLIDQEGVRFIVVGPYLRSLIKENNKPSAQSMNEFLNSRCKVIKCFKNIGYIGVGECPEGELTEIYEVIGNRAAK